jgi:hypothetical protein
LAAFLITFCGSLNALCAIKAFFPVAVLHIFHANTAAAARGVYKAVVT